MRIVVAEHHRDRRASFEGDAEECRKALLFAYPWLGVKCPGGDALALAATLDKNQAYTVGVEDGDIQLVKSEELEDHSAVEALLGVDSKLEALLVAAAFLAGVPVPEVEHARQAMLRHDENAEAAALETCGLVVTEPMLQALRAVVHADLAKAEPKGRVDFKDVLAVTPDGAEFAAEVTRALKVKQAEPVQLGGKHSDGTVLTTDPAHHGRILLKPGSGDQNPAAGDRQSSSSQSKREAAFWAVAARWGLGQYLPETHLLLIDGKEYAAIRLVPFSFKTMNKLRDADPGLAPRLFRIFLPDGVLHQWAAMDYILGNPDRNAGNIMARPPEVRLIDHGSAFAGSEFAPGTDQNSYVPFYLRAWAPADFKTLDPAAKVRVLPRVSALAAAELKTWLIGLSSADLATELHRFGIDPTASLARLDSLKFAAEHVPADLAINQAWVL